MRISDWSSDVCSSDLHDAGPPDAILRQRPRGDQLVHSGFNQWKNYGRRWSQNGKLDLGADFAAQIEQNHDKLTVIERNSKRVRGSRIDHEIDRRLPATPHFPRLLDQKFIRLELVDDVGHRLGGKSRQARNVGPRKRPVKADGFRSEEHTSELQSLMRISYAVFCLKKKKNKHSKHQ